MKLFQIPGAIVIVGAAVLAGCATHTQTSDQSSAAGSAAAKRRQTAVAVLSPSSSTANHPVRGQVTFMEETEGVRVTANIEGLTPGPHGFHIHEKGDCSAPDFTSAGGHFNPNQLPHGSPTDPQHHSGDFGNLEANQQGVARYERVFSWLSFKGTNSIIDRAVIVHEKGDDLKSQPAGNAGARLACGVIQQTP
ncbi:MAG TPA: superoxide dismutase family protein [Verrucomicrobiae bacterium]|nr:superoxide dismutase family protein [Verrucomicrobiae bacterium]